MKLIFAILVIAANIFFFGGTILGSLLLAIVLTVMVSIVIRIVSRNARRNQTASRGRTRRAKPAPPITDGDIGPYVKFMLERGNHDAVVLCLREQIPGSWEARRDMIALVEEHGRLQRSIRIAGLAGVPMPDEATSFSSEQIEMIADRARRMAFVHQHGAMNPRIAASLNRLVTGTQPLIVLSTTLRADLAESTGNPQWGVQEEKELLRKLERMSNTLRAMNTELVTDKFDQLPESEEVALLGSGSSATTSDTDPDDGRHGGQLMLVAKPTSSR